MSETWRRWLLVAGALTAAIGILLVVLALLGPPAALLELLFLPGDPDVATSTSLALAIGVSGSLMAGWGFSMLLVYRDPDSVERPGIARAFLAGLFVWFALDVTVSLASDAPVNVLGNVLFLVLLVPPLVGLAALRR